MDPNKRLGFSLPAIPAACLSRGQHECYEKKPNPAAPPSVSPDEACPASGRPAAWETNVCRSPESGGDMRDGEIFSHESNSDLGRQNPIEPKGFHFPRDGKNEERRVNVGDDAAHSEISQEERRDRQVICNDTPSDQGDKGNIVPKMSRRCSRVKKHTIPVLLLEHLFFRELPGRRGPGMGDSWEETQLAALSIMSPDLEDSLDLRHFDPRYVHASGCWWCTTRSWTAEIFFKDPCCAGKIEVWQSWTNYLSIAFGL